MHRLTGVLTALVVVLVNSLTVTYFIGTGRWCREVVEVYGLDQAFVTRSAKLKRSAFPFAMAGMLAIVAIVALGGAADPAAGPPPAFPPSGLVPAACWMCGRRGDGRLWEPLLNSRRSAGSTPSSMTSWTRSAACGSLEDSTSTADAMSKEKAD